MSSIQPRVLRVIAVVFAGALALALAGGCAASDSTTDTGGEQPGQEQDASEEATGEAGGANGAAVPADAGTRAEAEAILEDECARCHSLDRVYSADYDVDGWGSVVDRMIGYGANLDDEERALLVEYLAGL